jgi:hypothetical protein
MFDESNPLENKYSVEIEGNVRRTHLHYKDILVKLDEMVVKRDSNGLVRMLAGYHEIQFSGQEYPEENLQLLKYKGQIVKVHKDVLEIFDMFAGIADYHTMGMTPEDALSFEIITLGKSERRIRNYFRKTLNFEPTNTPQTDIVEKTVGQKVNPMELVLKSIKDTYN